MRVFVACVASVIFHFTYLFIGELKSGHRQPIIIKG